MPGLVINTNVASINGQRNLQKNSLALNKALERLSSGLRINRAGDDAAGLAISENLRSQIRGLNMAVQNCNDGVSLVQTADGAMNTYTEIAQRIRELAIQASSDVNSKDNRHSLQLEINEQVKELDRISKTMQFNGQNLFDGTFNNRRIQAGAESGQALLVSVGDLRTISIGGVAQNIGTRVDNVSFTDGDIIINGVNVPASATYTAADKAAAINSVYADTGVTARTEAAQITGATVVAPSTLGLATNDVLTINGVTIPSSGTVVVTASDGTGALRRAINAVSDKTGVQAKLDAAGKLVLTAVDDREFTANTSSTVSDTGTGLGLGIGTDVQVNGRLRLSSDSAFAVADGTGTALNLVGMTGSYAVDPTSTIDQVNVTTFENAQEAILKIDNSLRQINDVRAGLGALTNRLQNTISNLQISSENLASSDSRIRDADFAAETANLTRSQILQQSGVAVLAQANSSQQAVLQLLK